MPSNKINPDLVKERKNASFNVEDFAEWFAGGAKKLAERRNLEKIFLEDPELEDDVVVSTLSHKELYEHAIKKATLTSSKLRKYQEEGNDGMESFQSVIGGVIGSALIKEGNPLSLHFVMFLPTIFGQGTPEQQAEWLPRAWSCGIIGTYAQTELGHGTFLRGLEARADYDPKTEEFVLNSPTLTSYKWWPGGLGHTANHAVVMAQLYTQGKHCGIQPFIVQLRDTETHMPMPGIDIGDIGNKMGMKSVNNGFLGFKDVRIPRMHMLMKNAQVLADGTFVQSPASVLTYGTMMFVRVMIVQDVAFSLAKASTIATRYSAVRRQSPIDPNEPEPQIIDHITQQLKVFPNIAKAIMFKYSGESVWNMYNSVTEELNKGKLDRLPELHALSCCLKAIVSGDAANGIETLRLACGGHGYMAASNFPTLYGTTTAAVTYEGENTVMFLQTARYLVKSYGGALNGEKLVPTVAYLNDFIDSGMRFHWDESLENIVKALQFVAANKVKTAYTHLEQRKSQGISQEQAANLTGIELASAANLHGRAFIAQNGYTQMNTYIKQVSPALGKILQDLLEVYLLDAVLAVLGDVLTYIQLTDANVNSLRSRLESVLARIRPNAVAIVDGFDIPDRIIGSVLGAYDGNVYERIFAEAKKNPLNHEPVNQSFHKYLKPFMQAKL